MQNHLKCFKRTLFSYAIALLSSSFVIISACNSTSTPPDLADSISNDSSQRDPENALKGLKVFEGLAVKIFATEPMLKNPTNIDVDERGRVWVTEAYNYRPEINGNPTNPQGDRIVILEDADGDGRAEKSKVFYQGPELNAPLGIAVLGKRVIISQSPYVWAFYDDNGDDRADRKEILFQGIGGEQHDHGVHSFSFAPDGKLYFTFGNEGKTLKDRNNKTVLDQDGDPIGPQKYKQGMVFRCDPDGSNVECMGHNFRNNYEVAVDSYGTMWQSDNDDDGNKSVRINYVMQYGNYGYTDEITGAGWQANRTNIEDSIPQRHWHLNDPGVIPNLLQTGAGSPTGMVIYEGDLLPKAFHNQMIHTDAGPNVVRSYPVTKDGAGFKARIINILKGEKDQWFRPADICVAPDGSLIIADWYDPGVGGHQAGDQQRGRIYRVSPSHSKYKIPVYSYSNPQEAAKALQNPNNSARFHGWVALQKMGDKGIAELKKLWEQPGNPRMRARGFWALVEFDKEHKKKYIHEAITDRNPAIRIIGVRAATRASGSLVIEVVKRLVNDHDDQVRRECAIALRDNPSPEAAELWAILASQYNGKDRWYLEALGIGADQQWDRFFSAFARKTRNTFQTPAQKDIIWRARTELAVPYLAKFAKDSSGDLQSRLRYFRAFDFNSGTSKSRYLLGMIKRNTSNDVEFNKVVLRHLDSKAVQQSPIAATAMRNTLRSIAGTPEYIELVSRYTVKTERPSLLKLAIDKHKEPIGRDAAGLLLSLGGLEMAKNVLNSSDSAQSHSLIRALSRVGSNVSVGLLQFVALNPSYSTPTRVLAAEMIGKSWAGEEKVLELLKEKKVQGPLIPPLVAGVSQAWRQSVRDEAAKYLPNKKAGPKNKIPTLNELVALEANLSAGKAVFKNNCAVCHQVNKEGFDFGPKLSEIGTKLPNEALWEAIVHPSSGISFGYEGWKLDMKDGSTLTGIISSKTETAIDLKFPGGAKQTIKAGDVKSTIELPESMMPEDLIQSMNKQEFADLMAYLSSLKKN